MENKVKLESHKEDYLGILDGVRGLMALAVFCFHLELICLGKQMHWLGLGACAVDVFMFLSGFLMAYHWHIRNKKFNNFSDQSKDFYIRRFFRIAPLYYLLLAIALLGQKYFFRIKDYLNSVIPSPWTEGVLGTHTHNPFNYSINFTNVALHYTFLFGLFPQYGSNNVLPDWSIGLEMQFYLLFPFLMICFSRLGAFSTVMVSIILALITNKFIGLYNPKVSCEMYYVLPSLIFFKINIFISGICFAISYFSKNRIQCVPWLILGAIALINIKIPVVFFIFFIVFMLFFDKEKKNIFNRLMAGRIAKFLGDTSYSVYLVHELILLPILYYLFHYNWFISLSPYFRLFVAFVLISIPVYAISYILFKFVEISGIKLGRTIKI